jgi:hypothetical protein
MGGGFCSICFDVRSHFVGWPAGGLDLPNAVRPPPQWAVNLTHTKTLLEVARLP